MGKPKFKFSGDILQIRRKLLNYTLQNIADYVGVTRASVGNWENGKTIPEPQYMPKLAEIIEMKPQRLLLKDLADRSKVLNAK